MKMAILGAGGIATKMATTIREMAEVESYAIASRDLKKAEDFAKEYGMQHAYGSYEEMLADPKVDLVYIAVPHSHHHEWTLKALEAGKHVLCEKAFAVNEKQAREMIELAKKKGLLLAEAIWTRYMPSRKIITEIIENGTIGELKTISANLGYKIDHVERIMEPSLAGGALLDLTVYPLNFVSMFWGDDIKKIQGHCVKTKSGVDGQETVTIEYQDGRVATMFTTIYSLTDRKGLICGSEGFIEVENINNPESIKVYKPENNGPKLFAEYPIPEQITGFEYQVEACMTAIKEGKTECPQMPHSQIIEIMRQMDELRRQFEIVYPFE
ncbi:MAG TPA: Gfo/Idh/MocA family oxidoreductase [Lachnospiraceae bacterium]